MTTPAEALRYLRETENEIAEVEHWLAWQQANCPNETPKLIAQAIAGLQAVLDDDCRLWSDIAHGWRK